MLYRGVLRENSILGTECIQALFGPIVLTRGFSTIRRSRTKMPTRTGRRSQKLKAENPPPLPGIYAPVREFLDRWDGSTMKREKRPAEKPKAAKPKHRWGLVEQQPLSKVLRVNYC